MRKYTLLLLILSILMPSVASAQRRRSAKKAKKEEVVEDPRLKIMREATRKVVFIDSMVVEKATFISHIPLSKECGTILQKNGMGQYTNELGDRNFSAVFDRSDSLNHITMSDYIANQWTKPTTIRGIGNADANYPYLMPDGTTLYYAQKGENSIGGYDIFVTRYNPDNSAFLRPENIGMPFASEANDYLYVIDETQQLGYFVTDRRQPEGMVCIYIFIPSNSRQIYPSEVYTEEQIKSLSELRRIADTWGNGKEREAALERLKKAKATFAQRNGEKDRPASMSELDKMRQRAADMERELAATRKVYANATEDRKNMMREGLINTEQDLESLLLLIRQKEKEERNKNYQ